VGMADDPAARIGQHHGAPWMHRVREIRFQWCESREAAANTERAAILNEDPFYNIQRPGGDALRWMRWIIADSTGRHPDDVTDDECSRIAFGRRLAEGGAG
jgi:hypothetical protein